MNAPNVSSELPSGGYRDMQVIVDGNDGSTASGQLLGVTAREFRVRFDPNVTSAFEVGKNVRWRLSINGVELEPSLHAEVLWRHDRQQGREYGLRHQLRDESLDHLPEWLQTILKPRIAPRARARQAIAVIMSDEEGRWRVQGQLIDISKSGIGALFAPSVEGAFCAVTRVKLEIALPGETRPFHLVAGIRRRVIDSRGFLYGFEFDAQAMPDFAEVTERLDAFVTREIEEAAAALLARVGSTQTARSA